MSEGPNWSLSRDRSHLNVAFPTNPPVACSYDAGQVDEMIQNLCEMRAAMEPARPMEDPPPGQKIKIPTEGRWWIQPSLESGGVLLAICSPGQPWTGIFLDQKQLSQLLQTLLRVRPVIPETTGTQRAN